MTTLNKTPIILPWSSVVAREGRSADAACVGTCSGEDMAAWEDAWLDYDLRLESLRFVLQQIAADNVNTETEDLAVDALSEIDGARTAASRAGPDYEAAATMGVSDAPVYAIQRHAEAQARGRFADAVASALLTNLGIDPGAYEPTDVFDGVDTGGVAPPPPRPPSSGILPALGIVAAGGLAIYLLTR